MPSEAPSTHDVPTASGDAVPTIRLKTSLLVAGLHEESFALAPGVTTVAALLAEIGGRSGMCLVGRDGELIDFLDVRLNGRKIDYHPARLKTALQAGDQVVIQLVPIGGG
jgi:sulfur carrier protein ThiS